MQIKRNNIILGCKNRSIKINFVAYCIYSIFIIEKELHLHNLYKQYKKMKIILTILLLIISNVFMTLAWYGNLKLHQMKITTDWPLVLIILASWGVALVEYFFMIPANRIGSQITGGPFSLVQLKVLQEVISISVFSIIALFLFQGEVIRWNHIAAFVCLIMAVFFVFYKN